MKIDIVSKGDSKTAVIESTDIIIYDVPSALDLMAQVQFEFSCSKLIINKSNISEEFFDLKTGLAGEILQKFMNYRMIVAIIGDFSTYKSKSLKDFIYECNKGRQIFFLNDVQEAIDKIT